MNLHFFRATSKQAESGISRVPHPAEAPTPELGRVAYAMHKKAHTIPSN